MSRVTLQDLRTALRDGSNRALTELVIHARDAVFPVVHIHELDGALALEIADVEVGEYETSHESSTTSERLLSALEDGEYIELQRLTDWSHAHVAELVESKLITVQWLIDVEARLQTMTRDTDD